MSALLIIVIVVLVGLGAGYAVNLFWLRAATAGSSKIHGLPSCGRCGYPVRGITTFECPECGADLREVGIVRPGQRNGAGHIITVAVVYCIGFIMAAGLLYGVIESQLPTYAEYDASAVLNPASGAYDAQIEVIAEEVAWNQTYNNGIDFTTSSQGYPPSITSNTTIALNGLTPGTTLTELTLEITPTKPSSGSLTQAFMTVDPADMTATWSGLKGNLAYSNGPLTEQDLLKFFVAAGLDTTQQDIIDESKQFFVLLESVAQKKSPFTLTRLHANGAGSSASWGRGPGWFAPLFLVVTLALWLAGLIWIARRMGGKRNLATD